MAPRPRPLRVRLPLRRRLALLLLLDLLPGDLPRPPCDWLHRLSNALWSLVGHYYTLRGDGSGCGTVVSI